MDQPASHLVTMGDEVSIKLIFPNQDRQEEMTTSMQASVIDVKNRILEVYMASTSENVERLRLFAGGKELGGKGNDDHKSLREAKLTNTAAYPAPVHVVIVLKSSEPAAPEKETSKPTQCSCTLL